MVLAELETRAATRAMRVKTVEIALDEIGYEGWYVRMRTNPRSSVYDSLIALDDQSRWWAAFGQLVLEWNLADEDGEPIALPSQFESEHDIDLPYGLLAYVFKRYLEEFRAAAELPKEQPAPSALTSSISEGSQPSE